VSEKCCQKAVDYQLISAVFLRKVHGK